MIMYIYLTVLLEYVDLFKRVVFTLVYSLLFLMSMILFASKHFNALDFEYSSYTFKINKLYFVYTPVCIQFETWISNNIL